MASVIEELKKKTTTEDTVPGYLEDPGPCLRCYAVRRRRFTFATEKQAHQRDGN